MTAATRRRVFISHSAHEPRAKRLLGVLHRALKEAGYEPLLDHRALAPGERWRAIIDRWLYQCDAAVIVLSGSARSSDYLKYEASQLHRRWRTRPDRQSRIIPIVFPEVDLTIDFTPWQFGELQCVAAARRCTWKSVTDQVLTGLSKLEPDPEPRNDIERQVSLTLCGGSRDCDCLESVGTAFQLNPAGDGSKEQRANALTRALLELCCDRGPKRWRQYRDLIERTKAHLGGRSARDLVELTWPFYWVSAEVAAKILSISAIGSPLSPTHLSPGLAWRRDWGRSEWMYLRAAHHHPHFHCIPVADTFTGDADADAEHVRRTLAGELTSSLAADDGRINIAIQRRLRLDPPERCFLILPGASLTGELLSTIRHRWRDITVFVHKPNLDAAEFQSLNWEGLVLLEPELAAEDEDQARLSWTTLMRSIHGSSEPLQ